MEDLLKERRDSRKGVVLGRALLEVDGDMGELEESLGITEAADAEDGAEIVEEDDDDDESEDGVPLPLRKLQRHVRQYLIITRHVERVGPSHPFLQAQQPRLAELRKTLLLDLAAALRQAKAVKAPDAILAVVNMYRDLGAEGESVRVLKGG